MAKDNPPAIPPELLAIPGVAEALAGGASSTDPTVYMGETPRRRCSGVGGWGGAHGSGGGSDVRTEDEAVANFYTWSDEKVRDFQERAFAAGLYGTRDRSKIRWGDPTDGATFNLWTDRVQAAAGFYNDGAGRKITPWDALDMAGRGETGIPEEDGRQPLSIELSNPDDIKRGFREAARMEIGSGAVDEVTLDRIVDQWHAAQAQAQTANYAAAGAGGTVVQAPEFATFAEGQARALDPVKADSRGAVKVASVISQMLGGQQFEGT